MYSLNNESKELHKKELHIKTLGQITRNAKRNEYLENNFAKKYHKIFDDLPISKIKEVHSTLTKRSKNSININELLDENANIGEDIVKEINKKKINYAKTKNNRSKKIILNEIEDIKEQNESDRSQDGEIQEYNIEILNGTILKQSEVIHNLNKNIEELNEKISKLISDNDIKQKLIDKIESHSKLLEMVFQKDLLLTEKEKNIYEKEKKINELEKEFIIKIHSIEELKSKNA